MPSAVSVLIIDDDPVHLKIYRLIVETAGFRGLPVLATSRGIEFPGDEPVDAVLLDYRLAPNISARSVALQAKARYPAAPVVLLSDLFDLPADMIPIVRSFVRKGDPEKLLETLRMVIEGSSENLS